MTRGRGRGRLPGSGENLRATMDPALRAAIAGQAEKENAYVLSMITGADEHTDYYSDDDDDNDDAQMFKCSFV
jgi:hypothetical protein